MYDSPAGNIATIVLDASVSELHEGSVAITDHPVETGVDVSDHIRPQPKPLRIEGFLSDVPLTAAGVGRFSAGSHSRAPATPGRAAVLLTDLEAVRDAGTLVTVLTGLRRYADYAIVSISTTRDKTLAGALRFTMQLREVLMVDVEVVELPKIAAAKAPVVEGRKTGTTATQKEVGASVLYQATMALSAALKRS
jgi:hypothetical protein